MTLQELTPLIEHSLDGLGVDPVSSRGENPGHWSFQLNNSTIWVDVYESQAHDGKFYFQVMSPLCAVPAKRTTEFLNELLELNFSMFGSWMARKEGWVYVTSLREALNLDQSEIDATLDRITHYSTDYREKLKMDYAGCWEKATAQLTGERV